VRSGTERSADLIIREEHNANGEQANKQVGHGKTEGEVGFQGGKLDRILGSQMAKKLRRSEVELEIMKRGKVTDSCI